MPHYFGHFLIGLLLCVDKMYKITVHALGKHTIHGTPDSYSFNLINIFGIKCPSSTFVDQTFWTFANTTSTSSNPNPSSPSSLNHYYLHHHLHQHQHHIMNVYTISITTTMAVSTAKNCRTK